MPPRVADGLWVCNCVQIRPPSSGTERLLLDPRQTRYGIGSGLGFGGPSIASENSLRLFSYLHFRERKEISVAASRKVARAGPRRHSRSRMSAPPRSQKLVPR